MVAFPPNSGDLNPIETVWAELRKHLARREHLGMDAKRWLTPSQFRRRCSQNLSEFDQRRPGQEFSFLQKLVRGGRVSADAAGDVGQPAVKLLLEAVANGPPELMAAVVDATTENGTAALHTAARHFCCAYPTASFFFT